MKILDSTVAAYKSLSDKITQLMGVDIEEAGTLVPESAALIRFASFVSNSVNTKKLQDAWTCIARDENIETSINELYNYVSNEERAYYIASGFRKIILANSRISSSVIAYIMGEIERKNRDFDNDDIILFNALENMTDFDIKNFYEMMKNGSFSVMGGIKILDADNIPEEKKLIYDEVLEFGEKYRLFSGGIIKFPNGHSAVLGDKYAVKPTADRLFEYIGKVRQILKYIND